MRFNPDEWKRKAHENFEGAWHEGPSVLTPAGHAGTYPYRAYRRAVAHPVFATINRLRETYLALGFDEAENPVIIEEQDIYRQFGPEAMAVLDRVFYLGGLPRPNVGIARKQLDEINGILQSHRNPLIHRDSAPAGQGRENYRPMTKETEERLRETLHAYKKSEIDGDELTFELSKVLGVDDALVVHILDAVFPEFRALAPESSRSTLRSHMTSGWFLTLGSIWDKTPLPIRLFSVDRCFRREQAEGPTRLMTYHSASCVVAGEDITNEEGKAVSEALLSAFGYTDFRFQPDEKRSKYYMPDSQTEVYARHPVHGWVEVATFGMYSPSALADYGIGVPVMNLGLGVERLAMIAYQSDDVRQLCYPQFFPRALTGREIARAVRLRGAALTGGEGTRRGDCSNSRRERGRPRPVRIRGMGGDDRRHEGAGGGRGDRVHRETLRAGVCQRDLRPRRFHPRRPGCREMETGPDGRDTDRHLVSHCGIRACCGPDRGGGPVQEACHGPGQDGKTPERHQPEDR